MMRGRVLRAQSGFFWVQTEAGVLECKLRGRLKKARQETDIAVVGDEVDVTEVAPGEGAIEAVAERQSRFSRRQPGPRGLWKEDVLVANVDQIIIVFSCSHPPMKPRLLDRFLVITEYNDLEAVIVANKIDLANEPQEREPFALYETIGYPVLYASAQTGEGVAALQDCLAGRISVFTGPSGVGKSSLLNAIQPGLQLRTGEISETLGKGRHTTIVAELHQLERPAGGYVADTPGIRELANWRIPEEDLAWCFREMRPFLGQCEFNDCSHVQETGCAVREAVEQGQIDPSRYESFVRQLMNLER